MSTFTCQNCGKEFEVWPSRQKHGRAKHCSKKCQYENFPKDESKQITLTCLNCQKLFTRYKSWLKRSGGGKYCCRKCRDDHRIKENHPQFINGSASDRRGPNWPAQRRKALKRDQATCQQCGSSDDLHVHHKKPFRLFDSYKKANHLSNLITLCSACHRKEEVLLQGQ